MGGNRVAAAGNPVHTAEPPPLPLASAVGSKAVADDSKVSAVVVVGRKVSAVAVT